jgi:hypothetical protein
MSLQVHVLRMDFQFESRESHVTSLQVHVLRMDFQFESRESHVTS